MNNMKSELRIMSPFVDVLTDIVKEIGGKRIEKFTFYHSDIDNKFDENGKVLYDSFLFNHS